MSNGSTLSPSNQHFSMGGFPILGRASGSYFTMTYDVGQQIVVAPGVDGGSYFIDNGNYSATIVVNLLPVSVENSILQGFFQAARAAPNGLILPIIARSPAGVFSGFGRVAGMPPLEYSDSAVTVPWTIVSGAMHGGYQAVPAAEIG